jgi:hypothetical protein
MKLIRSLATLLGALALTISAAAQITAALAPTNFDNLILTSTPNNVTGAGGVSTVFSSNGTEMTVGTGGAVVNSARFNYTVTGPNSATITVPASGGTEASTTNLVFTSSTAGTYTTVQGANTTTGRFSLGDIPNTAPLSNVSIRLTLGVGDSSTLGFVITGTMPRRVLLRAVGPGLLPFGVSNAISNPTLTLFRGSQLLATNSGWSSPAVLSDGASAGTVGTASNSGSSSDTGSLSGTGSSQVPDLSIGPNVSSSNLGQSTTTGSSAVTFATGTVNGALVTGETFTTQLATSQDFSKVGAFELQRGSKDAAFVVTLPPGAYSAVVTNTAATTIANGGTPNADMASASSSTSTTSLDSSSRMTSNMSLGPTARVGSSTTSEPVSAGVTRGGALTGISANVGATTTGGAAGDVLVEIFIE